MLFKDPRDGEVIIDAKTGFIIDCNPEFERQTGRKLKQLKQLKIWEIRSSKDVETAKEIFLKARKKKIINPVEHEFQQPDGRIIPIEFTSKQVVINNKICLQSITRDITERKRIEETLKISEAKYRTIFESNSTALVILEDDTTISLANKMFEKLSGFSKQEIENKKTWIEFVVEEDLERMIEQHRLRRKSSSKALKNYEFRFKDRHGKIKNIYLTIDIIPGTNKNVASFLDITDKKQKEEKINHLNLVLKAIRNVNQLITTEKNIDKLLLKTCKSLTETRGYSCAWIALFNENGIIEKYAESGYGAKFNPAAKSMREGELLPCAKLSLQKKGIHVFDNPKNICVDCTLWKVKPKGSVMTQSIKYEKKLYGIITVSSPVNFILDLEEKDLLNEVTGDIAFALHDFENERKKKESQNALLNSEKKYRSLFEEASNMIHMLDNKGRFIDINKSELKKLGYKKKELLGKKFYKIIHPDLLEKSKAAFKKVITGKKIQMENVFVTKSGELINVIVNATPRFKNGEVISLRAIIQDVTQQKQIEELLKERKEKFKAVVDTANEGIISVDSSGKVIFWNPAAEKIFGYSAVEVMGKNFTFIMPKVFRKKHVEGLKRVIETGESKIIGKIVETVGLKKDGTEVPLEISLTRWKTGEGIFFTAIFRDITERQKNRKALLESEEMFRTFINSTSDIAFLKTGDFSYSMVNKAQLEFFNAKAEEVIGKNDYDLMNKTLADLCRQHDEQILRENKSIVFEEEDENRTFEARKFPVKLSDGTLGVGGLVRDITKEKMAQKAIIEKDEYIDSVFCNLHEDIFIINPDYTISDVNRKVELSSNRKKDEIVGKYCYTVSHNNNKPCDLEGEECYLKNVFEKSESKNYRHIHKDKYGKNRYVDIMMSPLKDADGNVKQVIEAMRDITDLYQAEEQILLQSTAMQASANAIMITDIEGNIEWGNKALGIMTGYSFDEVSGKNPRDLVKSDKQNKEFYKKMWDTILSGNVWQGELINRKKDGTLYTEEMTITPVYNERSEIEHFIAVKQDITERKEAANKLLKSEKKYKRFFDEDISANVVSKPDGTILDCNPAFVKIMGYKTKEEALLNNAVKYYKNFKDREKFIEELKEKKHFEYRESEIVNHNGEIKSIIENSIGIFDEKGNLEKIQSYLVDITDLKRTEKELIAAKEKAEEMNKLKSNFLANMSHELRTPMVGILGYTEILKEDIKNPELREYAKFTYESGNRLMKTLNLILHLSKIESGKLKVQYTKTDVVQEVKKIITLFEKSAQSKNIFLRYESKLDKFITNTDTRMLNEILNNLINNAIKFTQRGGVTVSLNKAEDSKYFQIKIKDTGIGIEKEKQKLIWEEFRQASEGSSRKFEGTGLGLSITNDFVKKLNGKITLVSDFGKGTEITFLLPIITNLDKVKNTKKESEKKVKKELNVSLYREEKPRLLYVEDDEVSRSVAKALLKNIYTIDYAIKGEDGIKLAKESLYDTILIDINLKSKKDGVKTMKKIKEIKGCDNIPIIAITAYAMMSDRKKYLESGFTDYISKPYTKKDLIEVINRNIYKH